MKRILGYVAMAIADDDDDEAGTAAAAAAVICSALLFEMFINWYTIYIVCVDPWFIPESITANSIWCVAV